MKKLPALHLYCGDLLKDKNFLACTADAQALWCLMLVHLHDMPLRGEFRLGSEMPPMSNKEIAHLLNYPLTNFQKLLYQIEAKGVSSRLDGALTNRRMVRERQLAEMRSKAGKKGMASRYQKANKCLTQEQQNLTPSLSVSFSSPILQKESTKSNVTNGEWLEEVKTDPLYAGINIDLELKKCQAWCKPRKRKVTRLTFTSWLIKAMNDVPIEKTEEQKTKEFLQRKWEG